MKSTSSQLDKPALKPANPCFSSGPCAKRPGWSLEALGGAALGRSHRSAVGKAKLKGVIDRHRALLGIPDDYPVGIVPASDTGAMEMALWSMLGARGVDVLAWESFSTGWMKDITGQLKLEDARCFTADYGDIPDLSAVDTATRDVVFVWNGTTSGVCVPDGNWIAAERDGLTICDATSAVFAYDLPWDKLDVTTWSWQKVLGGEAAHGMIVLSPRAVERLASYTPPWPLPKIFRMTKSGALIEGIFKGETINTPSMLAVEDALDTLRWIEGIGGLQETIRRSRENFAVIEEWVRRTPWIDFLAADPACRSRTSVCLRLSDPEIAASPTAEQWEIVKALAGLLEAEGAAYDIKTHKDSSPGLRLWAAATVESDDLRALTPWLDWAFATVRGARLKNGT